MSCFNPLACGSGPELVENGKQSSADYMPDALKWGHGSDRKVARLLSLNVGTVVKGREQLLQGEIPRDRIRKPGAGHPALVLVATSR